MLPRKDDPYLAEFVGIMLGDGSINRTYQNRIQITLNKNEKAYREHVVALVRKLFGIEPIVKFRKNENAVDIMIFRKFVIDYLIDDVGLIESPKWNRQVVPEIFMKNDMGRFILRGYFDTDGSVVITDNNGTTYPRIEMKVCPSPMKDSIVKILDDMGFRFGCYSIENGRFRIQMNGRSQASKWLKEVGIMNPSQSERLSKIGIKESIAGDGFEPSTYGL